MENRHQILAQEKGFSLLETIVGIIVMAGIIGGIVYGILTISGLSGKAVITTMAAADFSSMENLIEGALNDPKTCQSVLGHAVPVLNPAVLPPTNPKGTPVVASPLVIGNTTITVNQRYGSSLTVTALEISHASLLTTNQYVSNFHIAATKLANVGLDGNSISKDFKILITLDAGSRIVGCSSYVSSLWDKATNNANNIYYYQPAQGSGYVGIGTKTPTATLDVEGTGSVLFNTANVLIASPSVIIGPQALNAANATQTSTSSSASSPAAVNTPAYTLEVEGTHGVVLNAGDVTIGSSKQNGVSFEVLGSRGVVLNAGDVLIGSSKLVGASLDVEGTHGVILNAGAVSIGRPSTPATNVTLYGGLTLDNKPTNIVTASDFLYYSDERLKQNIHDIPEALSKVSQLRGVNFEWKSNSQKKIGFIAQEVEKIFPEAVITDLQTGMKSVEYGNLIAPVVEALKAQQILIEHQQNEIRELRNLIQQRAAGG